MTPEEKEARERALVAAYRSRLNPADPQARMILEDLASRAFAADTTHVPGDPYTTARNEGMRALNLYIMSRAAPLVIPEG